MSNPRELPEAEGRCLAALGHMRTSRRVMAYFGNEVLRAQEFAAWVDSTLRSRDAEIAALREALRAISVRMPVMGSTGEYRRGQIDALNACGEVASSALSSAAAGAGSGH